MGYRFEEHKISGGIDADDEFWRGLERGEFLLPRCAGCGAWTWPAHFRCGKCGSWEFAWTSIEPKGTLFAWTRAWYPFVQARAEQIPYVTIMAEIDGSDGARVMGVLKGSEDGLEIGARVRGEIDPPTPEARGYPAIRWVIEP